MSLRRTSKYISLILRHKPEAIGITLDEHGWANVDDLIAGINRTHPLTMETLEQIVREDQKQRYSFNEDKTLIRANQGHSIPVDVELKRRQPLHLRLPCSWICLRCWICCHGRRLHFHQAVSSI